MKKPHGKILAMGLASSFLFGCSLTKPIALPQISRYTLSNTYSAEAVHRSHAQTLLVSQTTAEPGYQSTDMVYREKPHELQRYSKNRWVAPPAQMITPLIAQSLASSRYYRAVVVAPFVGQRDLRLDTHLIYLRQHFSGSTSDIEMAIQARLIDRDTQKVIAAKRFHTIKAVNGSTPYAGVVAANDATEALLKEVTGFCLKYSVPAKKA